MELRYTDTNAADDSAGRAFGLDGDLYLPLVLALVGAIGLTGLLGLGLRTSWIFACAAGALPLATVVAWVLLLKHGKPPGYDRDRIDEWMQGRDFGRTLRDQEGFQ